MIWLVPAALWGLVAIAAPILVHLLTRHERRPLQFPSLRFLSATRLTALRQRRLHDWWLLALRIGAIAAAAAALAGPLLATSQRERAWVQRTSRAIVTIGSAKAPADEVNSAFSHSLIPVRGRTADAIRAAVDWLAEQPPSRRELVIVGDIREGVIEAADLSGVPRHVGVRVLPNADQREVRDVRLSVLTRGQATEQRHVQLSDENTTVDQGREPVASLHQLEVKAAAEDQAAADAALVAVLDEGFIADVPEPRHVIVSWSSSGAPPHEPPRSVWMVRVLQELGFDGHDVDGALVIDAGGLPEGVEAVNTLRRIAAAVFDDPTMPQEPRRVSAADLARWSRPGGGVPTDAVRQDEGDRRFLWALVLILLAIEWAWRRRSDRTAGDQTSASAEEARVA